MSDPNQLDLFPEEENTSLTLSEIYNTLAAHGELILTIPIEDEATLRKGLASVKAKQNAKLKDAGLQPDNLSLSFTMTPNKEDSTGELIDVHIVLAKRTSIKIHKMVVPDPEI